MVTLLIMTNGRKKYLESTMDRLKRLNGDFSRIVFHDDSGDASYRKWLSSYGHEVATSEKVGFPKAMISAWESLKKDKNEWVFHLEEDFIFMEDVFVEDMISVMEKNKHIVEMVLLRQPIGGRERQKGGIVASHPERYEDKTDGKNHWMEHRVNFSCNPCLYRKSLIYEYPWPDMTYSEREYGKRLMEDPEKRFAYWGKRTDSPKVLHIGDVRAGFDY